MPSMLPAIVASLCSSLILTLVFAFLYAQYRERHIGIWTWGWCFYSLRFAFVLVAQAGYGTAEAPHLVQFCVLGSALFLLWGTNEFLGRSTSRRWIAAAGLGVFWIIWSHLADLSFFAQTLPVFLGYAVISLWTGTALLRTEGQGGRWQRMTGWAFILWGLHKADYPFLRHLEWFAPWGFLLGSLFGLIVAMGMLLAYFQKVRNSLHHQERRWFSSREHYRRLVETIPHGVVECDREGRILYANHAYHRMHGVEAGEVVGRPIWEMAHVPEVRARLEQRFRKGWGKRPESFSLVVDNLTPRGERVSRQVDWNYLPGEGQEPEGLIAVVTDVTMRKRAEDMLRATTTALKSIFQAAPLATIAIDNDGAITLWNPAASRLLGWEEGQVLGQPVIRVLTGHARESSYAQAVAKALEGEQARIELSGRRQDGREVELEVSMAPLFLTENRISGVILMLGDVTERRRMERALRDSEENYRSLVERISVPMVVLRHGRYLYLNPAASRLHGVQNTDDLEGRFFSDFVSGEHGQALELLLGHDFITEEESRHAHLDMRSPDGRELELDVTILPVNYGGESAHLAICVDVTHRREAERQLRRQSELVQTILNTIPAPIFYKDDQGIYLGGNRAFEDYIGLPLEKVIGSTVYDVAPAELAAIYEKADRELIERGGVQVYETSVKYADGTLHDVMFHKAAFTDREGGGGLVGAILDITDRKRAEQALRESEKRLRTTFETSPDPIALARAEDGALVEVNEGFLAMTGFRREEVLGKNTLEIKLWQDAGRREQFLTQLTETGSVHNMEAEFRMKDGSLRTGLLSARIISLAGEAHFLVTTRDISDIRRAEAARRESEERYRRLSREFQTLLDGIADPLILVSPDLQVVWANRGTARMVDAEPSQLKGHLCHTLWGEGDGPCRNCPTLRSFASGAPESEQLVQRQGRIWEVRSFPITDEKGAVQSVIEMRVDVSAQINLQKENIRTSQLAALGELAAGVAHEINNPVTGVINYAQIMVNKSAEGTLERDMADRILREGERIASIVSNLLSFSRDKREEPHPADLRRILEDALELSSAQLRKDGTRLVVSLPGRLPPIRVRPQQIQQVFINVLNNARYALNQKYPEAVPEKLLEITARVEPQEKDGAAMVRVCFRDQGHGVAEADLEKILNPFFTTKPPGQGTGLGLSISHGIIKDHGGQILIESRAGEFTEVRIDLPAVHGGVAPVRES